MVFEQMECLLQKEVFEFEKKKVNNVERMPYVSFVRKPFATADGFRTKGVSITKEVFEFEKS